MEWVFLIVLLGLIFDYTNGFHDAANVVSTVIATKVLRPFVAICMAGVLNTLGATQIGNVAHTITTGLIETPYASQSLVLAALCGAILWNILTWYFGIPSSSSYALVGGLVGAACVAGSSAFVLWQGVVGKVVIPMVLSPLIGLGIAFALMSILKRFKRNTSSFGKLQVLSAGAVALSHGLNDAQKSMGIITLGLLSAGVIHTPQIPLWVILSCALVMGLGTASGGFRIIRTVGYEITQLKPIQGFAAETSASCVILLASYLGMPISSTHMIVGSVTGVGVSQGKVHWHTGKKLIVAWILTLPGSGLFAGLVYKAILTVLPS